MKSSKLNMHRRSGDEPAHIEVGLELEQMIVVAVSKVTGQTQAQVQQQRIPYMDEGVAMVRYNLPDFDDDQFSLLAWHAGEWYVRMEPLVNVNLN